MRVLVFGGRDFEDVPALWAELDRLDRAKRISVVIDGAQQKRLPDGRIVGADYWGNQWAKARNRPEERYPADWDGYGRSAGPRRNQRMIDEGKPDLAVSAPGGRGTADMTQRAVDAGVPVHALRAHAAKEE